MKLPANTPPVAWNVSRAEIEGLKEFPARAALISISDQHAPWPKLQFEKPDDMQWDGKFSDINTELLHDQNWLNPISVNQAAALVRFIEHNKDRHFIVHCEAGISRSAGVCLFIHYAYGHDLKGNFWNVSEPQPFLIGQLFKEHSKLVSRYDSNHPITADGVFASQD